MREGAGEMVDGERERVCVHVRQREGQREGWRGGAFVCVCVCMCFSVVIILITFNLVHCFIITYLF